MIKPEKSVALTGVGILTVFTVGLLFTLLGPSYNNNWSADTAENEPQYHAVYKAAGHFLYRQWPDGSQEKTEQTNLADGTVVGYTKLEEDGRRIYQREGCVYCHSQQIRPLRGEIARYSVGTSVAIPADEREYVFDQPHFLGTRRIGPDLSREGGKYSDDWQYSHMFSPRMMVPGSVMPAFTWLFTTDPPNNPQSGVPTPTYDARALIAYIQTLGFGRLIHEPSTYKTHGGWGPWLRPQDQQYAQAFGESQVIHSRQPVRGGDKPSPVNQPGARLAKPTSLTSAPLPQ